MFLIALLLRTYASNFNSRTSQSTKSRLSTWSRSLGLVTSGSSQLDVKGSDSEFLFIHTHRQKKSKQRKQGGVRDQKVMKGERDHNEEER